MSVQASQVLHEAEDWAAAAAALFALATAGRSLHGRGWEHFAERFNRSGRA